MREIPEVITHLTNLTHLDLFSNQLREIPETIARLINLMYLDLFKNQLTSLPEKFAELTNLRNLFLSFNQLTKTPEALTHLPNLGAIYLSGNGLTEIPNEFASLTNLTRLILSDNQLTEISDGIVQLTSLMHLDISRNQLTEIPEAIDQLINLTNLDLSGNKLTKIPETIAQLTNLSILTLRNNQLIAIPDMIVKLLNLTNLDLASNRLTEIPEAIAQLSSLKLLILSSNRLTEIPDTIAQLSSLEGLILSSNRLTEIPDTIAQLTNLEGLFLFKNQFIKVPNEIAQLTSLTYLDIAENQLTEIPDWLEDLPRLENLYLSGNPLPISPELLASPGSPEDIFNYCRQLRSGKVRPLNEAKLLLVGQGSVGKTCLINRLLHRTYNPNESQTDGLNVQPWIVNANSKDVRLNVWDFGGQEIYHATHQFFLTKRSLYLLVCNCRTSEDENRLEYWLKLINSFGDQSPVIIVGNKNDEQPLDINRKALREKYPNITAILETSCQTNEGIDKLREEIITQVAQLKEVYDLLPLSWFEVKEQLEAMDEDFISYSKYERICESKNIPEEHNQEQLIDLLHRLGLVLSFRNHPLLQNTNVLNPDWVTQGIYTLLSDDRLKSSQGILTPTDLSRILPSDRYPTNRHPYLTELMKEFQLCFEIDRPSTFLIPGLLPKDEPNDTTLEGDTLEFQYHYRVLPESILSRFIVLMHDKIHNQIYWRSGVMLAYTEGSETYNLARVKADTEDKKIFISINGRESTRRSFLLIIRDVFIRIHSSIKSEITEWVPVPGYPDHPPLDYQELLGLEAMGEREYAIGKLRIKVNLRQLLDGYEAIESRQRRKNKFDIDGDYDEDNPYIVINDNRSRNTHQHGKRDNFGGDRIQGNKINET
jgi:internalin A